MGSGRGWPGKSSKARKGWRKTGPRTNTGGGPSIGGKRRKRRDFIHRINRDALHILRQRTLKRSGVVEDAARDGVNFGNDALLGECLQGCEPASAGHMRAGVACYAYPFVIGPRESERRGRGRRGTAVPRRRRCVGDGLVGAAAGD